jgi:pimeloyl-ACP methyl ester carboxylesterase
METRIAVDGAELAVTTWGSGPPVLVLPGGCGAADSCAGMHDEWADRYTLVAFDRRGHFHSSGRVDAPMPIGTLAEDAAAVVEQICGSAVTVFGTSAGAVAGLELAVRHPRLVRGVVAHDPPLLRLLPDAEHWRSAAEHVIEVNAAGHVDEAYQLLGAMVGLPSTPDAPPLSAELRPEWDYLFRNEWRQFFEYQPDVLALGALHGRLTMASDADTPDSFQARAARVLAEQLGVRHLVLPGDHLGPVRRPQETARALGPAFAEL